MLDATSHGARVVQHFFNGDRQRVLVAQHGLREGIANQHDIDSSFVDEAGGGVVVGSQARDRFVPEFLFSQG